jgi:hypothetical protein
MEMKGAYARSKIEPNIWKRNWSSIDVGRKTIGFSK